MPLPRTARLAAVLVLGLAAGCADRFYEQTRVSPTEPRSQSCLDRCSRHQDECRARQDMREQECQAQYSSAMADYDSCVGSGASNCRRPDTCLGADMSICTRQYDSCFTDCGGRVERRLRARPWSSPAPESQTPPAAEG